MSRPVALRARVNPASTAPVLLVACRSMPSRCTWEAPLHPWIDVPEPERADSDVVFRRPQVEDGARLWRLARASESLDLNSAYFYLLFCTRFAPTSVVAAERSTGRLLGFVAGLRWPHAPETVFVWQVAVDAEARGRRLASRLLDALLRAEACRRVTHLESTVTPSNRASLSLFRSLARRWKAACDESIFLRGEDFPAEGAHEAELLLRIGPLGTPDAEGRP